MRTTGGPCRGGRCRPRETHAGQQSTERLVQVKSSVQFTHEQLRIISHPLQSDHVVKIVAFAGTGKTTTLLQLCKRRPDQRFLLVVYNKSVQEHCEKTFPNNTTVKTAHAMAYASVGSSYQAVHKFSMNITASSLNEFLPSKKGVGNKLRRVALAKNTLERYLNSADEHLSWQHVPTVDKKREALDDDYRLQVILPDAEAIWNEMKRCSATQALPMTQEGQLKLWQLSRPKLTGYDVVMVDEGQDMNPAMLDVFSRQSCAKVIVGDPYQQIYSFRGAINALENVTSTHTFYLTQSFRFGPEVAYVAQCVLETLCRAEGRTLVGGHKRDCIIATGEDIEASCPARKMRTAYLGRSNCEVYETALMMCRKESYASFTMTFAGGLDKYGLDTLMDIFKLSQVEKGKGTAVSLGIKNGLVAKFRSVASLKIFAKNLDDREMGNKVNMFNYSGSNTPRHVQLLKMRCSAPQDTAQITFSTIHKAKGMEWDHVVLLAGTLATCLSHVNDPRGVLGRDEINLLYVSVTRAKKYLTVNATMLEVLRLSKERMEVVVGGGRCRKGVCVCSVRNRWMAKNFW
ncbi:F-box DNA helicase 1 [Chionoecetes opilio]|uniref:DNA 3'-5' helicase n=1 Tax=Chionoecetes opilio TaxID=41210 RepID=A0A8J4YGI6_CHIOP|nr:F-box DNA helicase 1 [Chionoecetes opilio]